ncbi:MAG TPA: cobalt ECF transporter T component CbiQ [Bryobacteraceae bacterium]|nr:cobalt ECF transporter T component CbiQ [Bryobacteraceae bacterium]
MSDFHPSTRGGFLENTLQGLHSAMERALSAETAAENNGVLQSLDARVKVAGLLAMVITAALSAKLRVTGAILILAVLLAALSRISLRTLAARAWLGALVFSGLIAIPAVFLTPGAAVLGSPMTVQGIRAGSFLVLRAVTAATLIFLLGYTTPWSHILKALRIFRVPVVFVLILGMTIRYIVLLLETAHDLFQSRSSRRVNRPTPAENRRLAITSSGVLLTKSLHLSGEVYQAMVSRGFRGEVYLLDDFEMRARDWIAAGAFATLAAASLLLGR